MAWRLHPEGLALSCSFYTETVRRLSSYFYAGCSLTRGLCAHLWRHGMHLLEIGGAIWVRMAKSKKNKNKPKLNLTVREEQRNKLEQMAALEKRSVSNLIEVMADERWERLAEQQGVAFAKTVAEAMNLNLDADNPADRAKFRRAVLDLVAERKTRKRRTQR